MSFEKPTQIENKSEHIPTLEEIQGILGKMFHGEFDQGDIESDDHGPYRIVISLPGDAPKEILELEYRRSNPPNKRPGDEHYIYEHAIYSNYYDAEGYPIAPPTDAPLARYLDGQWHIYGKPWVCKEKTLPAI